MNYNNSKDDTEKKNDPEWIKTVSEKSSKTTTGNINSFPMNAPSMPNANMGEKLGSGVIAGILGEGGMGRVYKIWCEDLELYRAVKVVIHNKDISTIKRFQREAKLTARLDHTNIVRVFGTGIWKSCRFIEMEYIEGSSFDILLKQYKRFNTPVCLAIGIITAKVLTYAHNHQYTLDSKECTGLVHRDLKPSNFMLTNTGKLKVLDFGIARPVGEDVGTLTTGIVGSMNYLPPEQLDGSTVDYRADIYALGAMLYELASGTAAFPFTNHRDFYHIKSRGIYNPLTKVCPDIPDSFSHIVDRCLKVNPKHRFNNAAELIEAFRNLSESMNDNYNRVYDENTDCLKLDFQNSENKSVKNPKRTTRIKTKTKTTIKPKNLKKSILLMAIVMFTVISAATIWLYRNFYPLQPNLFPPVLIKPENSKTSKEKMVKFVWEKSENALLYDLELFANGNFINPVKEYTKITDTFFNTKLEYNKNPYYWRVASRTGDYRSRWSEVRSFILKAQKKLLSPKLILPENNKKDSPLSVEMVWYKIIPYETYVVEMSKQQDFGEKIKTVTVTDTFYVSDSLEYETIYYWRARIDDSEHKAPWSTAFSFKTAKKELTREEILSEKYNSSDMVIITRKAIKMQQLDDAEYAFKHINKDNPKFAETAIRFAYACLNSGMSGTAERSLSGIFSEDASIYICRGRILMQKKNYHKALQAFMTAQGRYTTIYNYHKIIRDASYFYAEAAHNLFISDPTVENRNRALKAWEVIITKLYNSNKSDQRFKNAVRASNQVAQTKIK